MALEYITKQNFTPQQQGPRFKVYHYWYNLLVEKLNSMSDTLNILKGDTISEATSNAGVTVDGVLLKDGTISTSPKVVECTTEVVLTAANIVGNSAGALAHAGGAILVAAPSSDYALEFVSAVLIYDYSAAAYGGGNNDLIVRVGTVAHSTAISNANCLGAAGDKVYRVGAIATELSLPVGTSINLYSTAFTQPGTAAGVLRVQVTYRKHTTGL